MPNLNYPLSFSDQADTFRRKLSNPEDYALLVSDLEEIATNPSVDNESIFDHPEGRIAWTERFRIVFSVGPNLFVHTIDRRGPTPRVDEPLGL